MTEPQLTDQLRALRIDPPDNGFGLRLERALEREARRMNVPTSADGGLSRLLSASSATQWGRRGLAGLAVAASVSAAWFAANWDERANLGAERDGRSSAELEATPALPSTPEPPRSEEAPLTREAHREQDDAKRAPERREAPRDESPRQSDAPVPPTTLPVDAPTRALEPAPLRAPDARSHGRERNADVANAEPSGSLPRRDSADRDPANRDPANRDPANRERGRAERERPSRALERLELPDVERRMDRERERRESLEQSRERDGQRDWIERRRLREDDARSRESIDERRPEYRDPRREVEREVEREVDRTRDVDRDRRGIDARGERRLQRSESR